MATFEVDEKVWRVDNTGDCQLVVVCSLNESGNYAVVKSYITATPFLSLRWPTSLNWLFKLEDREGVEARLNGFIKQAQIRLEHFQTKFAARDI